MVSVIGHQAQVALMPSATDRNSQQPETTSRAGSAAPEGDATTVGGGYTAKRYAVRFDPPCIFLEYEDTTRKRRVREVKLTSVQGNVDVDKLTRKVIRSFPRKLEASSVKYDQVRKFVVALVDYLAASSATANGGPGRNGTPHGPSRLGPGGGSGSGGSSSHDGGAGRLSDSDGTGAGAGAANSNGSFSSPLPTMSPRVDGRGLPHGRLGGQLGSLVRSSGYRGSIESTMSRFSTSTAGSSDESVPEDEEHEDGDEEEDGAGGGGGLASALDDLDREMAELGPGPTPSSRPNLSGGSSDLMSSSRDSSFSARDRLGTAPSMTAGAPPPSPATRAGSGVGEGLGPGGAAAAAAAAGGARSRFAAEAEKLSIGMEVTDDTDLNKVTEVELRMAKLAMEENFRRNQLRPGDPGYVYDKQAEFGPPTEDNDWDDSGDEEEEPEASEEPEVDWEDIQAAVRKPTSVVVKVPAGAPPLTGPGSNGIANGNGNGNGKAQSPYNSNDWP